MEFFGATGPDPFKPSLFELISQEQLRDLLQPALKYVLAVFAQRYPRYLIKIINRHEEFYALVMFIVERFYLRKYNASFAENFYGLKRRRQPYVEMDRTLVAVGGIPKQERLRDRDIWRSLVFLIGIPYLRAKAKDYFEQLGGGLTSDVVEESGAGQLQALSDNTFKGHLIRVFKAVYPYANMAFELWLLTWNMSYLFDRTPHYRPWLSWLGLDIRRLTTGDLQIPPLATKGKVEGLPQSLLTRLRNLIGRSPRLVLDSLRLLLPTAIFFVKFLEWWYSPGSPARSFSASPKGLAIPPPNMLPPHPQGIAFDKDAYGICPICKKSIANATVLPSGYVFCYRCAYDQVEKYKRCPITLLPVQIWQLRKVLVLDVELCNMIPEYVYLCSGRHLPKKDAPRRPGGAVSSLAG